MLVRDVEEIRIPVESANDDSVVIIQWHAENGAGVKSGDMVVTIETSKTTFDIEAPRDGYLYHRFPEGSQVGVGEALAVITPDENFCLGGYEPHYGGAAEAKETGQPDKRDGGGTRISKSAQRLIEEHRISPAVFRNGGMVTERDVLDYLSNRGEERADSPAAAALGANGNKLLILGGGGHAKICIDIINQMKTFDIAGIIDQSLDKGSRVMGIPVVGRHQHLREMYDQGVRMAINGVGATSNPRIRQKVYEELKSAGFQIPNIIHPRASIEPSVKMGEGNQIMANAVVGAEARIRNNCVVNAGAIVSHDCVLHDNTHLAPGGILAGGVSVGRNTLIGMGSTIYLHVKVGDNVTIFNSCNVTRNVPDNTTVRHNHT